jgi:CRISPR system Cascade subunit CasA
MTAPRPEHWAYSLVTLQTSGGFDGRMNYGVARMNGGYGNRPSIAAARDPGWSTRFIRDVGILLSCRAKLIEEGHYGYTADGGHLLLWTLPWDGSFESQLSLPECDPFFVEVCRRVRLIGGPNCSLVGRRKGSAAERIAAKDLHGNVGDIWVPIRLSDGAALTARDLSYKLLQEILFSGDWKRSSASESLHEDGSSPLLLATAMVRGQGKTDGLYERQIRVPGKARALLATGAGRERLGQRSREFVTLASEIETKVLKRALLTLIQGGPDRVDLTDDRCKPLVNKLDGLVDTIFFDRLFDLAEADAPTALASWSADVIDLARGILAEGIDGLPVPEARRPRAIALAELRFNSRAREILGRYQTSGEEQSDERSDK